MSQALLNQQNRAMDRIDDEFVRKHKTKKRHGLTDFELTSPSPSPL